MCLSACLWANINKVYYGCDLKENEKIGFRDNKFDKLLGEKANLKNFLVQVDEDACKKLFEKYQNQVNKIIY